MIASPSQALAPPADHRALPSGLPRPRRALVVAGLALAAVPLIAWFRVSPQDDLLRPGQGDIVSQLVWASVYALVLLALLARANDLLDTPLHGKTLWALAALAPVSALWSEAPAVSLRQGTGVVLAAAFGFFVATRLPARELVVALSWILLGAGLLSAAVALALPERGLDHLRGDAWSGVFSTKNELGRVMAFATFVWLLRLVSRDGRRSLCLAAIAFTASLVVLSSSRTAFVVLGASAALVSLLAFLRRHRGLAGAAVAAFVAAAGAVAYWLDANADAVLHSVETRTALSGRTGIWIAVWDMIREQPWLGYGHGAFWRGIEGPSAVVWERTGDLTPHAHNGFLDLWLGLGLVGLLLFGATAVVAVRRSLEAFDGPGPLAALWPLGFLAFLALYNLSESTLVGAHSVFWILYAAIVFRPGRLAGAPAPRGERTS